MNKKLAVIITAIVLVVALVAGVVYFGRQQGSNSLTQEQAIEQARAYKPTGICTQSLVPAVHKATGAKYTFSSGCLAPGWEPEQK